MNQTKVIRMNTPMVLESDNEPPKTSTMMAYAKRRGNRSLKRTLKIAL